MKLRINDLPVMIDLPPGEAGTDATVEAMRAIIDDAQRSRLVREFADDYGQEPGNLWRFLRHYVAFEADPPGAEVLRLPDTMLREIVVREMTAGDCDDRTMLGASLAKAAGYEVAIVVMTPLPDDPAFRHVLFAVRGDDGRWVGMDAQEGYPPGTWPAPERMKAYVV